MIGWPMSHKAGKDMSYLKHTTNQALHSLEYVKYKSNIKIHIQHITLCGNGYWGSNVVFRLLDNEQLNTLSMKCKTVDTPQGRGRLLYNKQKRNATQTKFKY